MKMQRIDFRVAVGVRSGELGDILVDLGFCFGWVDFVEEQIWEMSIFGNGFEQFLVDLFEDDFDEIILC